MGASEEVVRWFLDHGADPNAYAKLYMLTPLSRAVQFAPMSIIQLLLDHGGDATKGELVCFACRRDIKDPNNLPLLNLLYERGAPIDIALFESFPNLLDVTMFHGTPLWSSCARGNIEVVRFLLEHGANPWKKLAISNDSPLDMARRSGHSEIVSMLLESSAR